MCLRVFSMCNVIGWLSRYNRRLTNELYAVSTRDFIGQKNCYTQIKDMSTLDHRQRNINQKPVICTHTDVRRHLYIKKKKVKVSLYINGPRTLPI